MPRKINLIKNSRFMSKDDADPPRELTIDRVELENIAGDGQPEEEKYVLYFAGEQKALVLNWTNAQLAAQVCGTDDMDGWPGKTIEAYHDPNVSFGGKLVGGIRIRPVRTPKETIDSDRPSVA